MKYSYSEKLYVQFSRSSRNFGEDLEVPRNNKIYSSGNQGVKKGLRPRGSRDEEFLVPSLSTAKCLASFLTVTKYPCLGYKHNFLPSREAPSIEILTTYCQMLLW